MSNKNPVSNFVGTVVFTIAVWVIIYEAARIMGML